jgi:signal transduction histidine kinase
VNLDIIIHEMMDIVKPQVVERNLTMNLISTTDSQLFVKSDRQRLKQILLNLINNALKYNREGGSIFIQTKIKPADPVKNIVPVRISITDTGMGISQENLSKLFIPFERFGAEKTATEGTGLGLAVVKKLIDAMGGNLGVESTPNVGSTFWVELPHCESQLERAEKSGQLTDVRSETVENSGTVLYIEDNSSNVELVDQILSIQRPGINLITNAYGRQAVGLALNHRPSLILLDLNLPDIHGSEVLGLLLAEERTKNIPVVIISADAMQQQLDRLLKAGARHYLTKPLNVPDLLQVVDEFIKN